MTYGILCIHFIQFFFFLHSLRELLSKFLIALFFYRLHIFFSSHIVKSLDLAYELIELLYYYIKYTFFKG